MTVSYQLYAPADLFQGQNPSVPITERWVGTRTEPDAFKKRQISCPCQELIHDSSVVHLRIVLVLKDRENQKVREKKEMY
jgi:hypothetical protein